MNERTPDELLADAKTGDTHALGLLIKKYQLGVYRYGLHVCQSTEDAEDAIQETLWAVTQAITTFRGSATSIIHWMFTIIRRECFRLTERHRRSPITLGGTEDRVIGDNCDPEDILIARSRAKLLAEGMNGLERAEREVILLRDIQQLSAPEAALRLNISVKALKSRLHRARVKLREHVIADSAR
jgi:RNA polymerase sigma-70 factor (ECF subfamily)